VLLGLLFETGTANHTKPAAAELDHFLLRKKLGLKQSSRKAPALCDSLSVP
jgi:hypothetical protein